MADVNASIFVQMADVIAILSVVCRMHVTAFEGGRCYCPVADGIATFLFFEDGRCYSHYGWQMSMPSGRWNSHCRVGDGYLVDVVTKVADRIATGQFILCYF